MKKKLSSTKSPQAPAAWAARLKRLRAKHEKFLARKNPVGFLGAERAFYVGVQAKL